MGRALDRQTCYHQREYLPELAIGGEPVPYRIAYNSSCLSALKYLHVVETNYGTHHVLTTCIRAAFRGGWMDGRTDGWTDEGWEASRRQTSQQTDSAGAMHAWHEYLSYPHTFMYLEYPHVHTLLTCEYMLRARLTRVIVVSLPHVSLVVTSARVAICCGLYQNNKMLLHTHTNPAQMSTAAARERERNTERDRNRHGSGQSVICRHRPIMAPLLNLDPRVPITTRESKSVP